MFPSLVKLYMTWKYATPTTRPHSPMTVDPPLPMPPNVPPANNCSFSIELLDIYTLESSVVVPYSNDEFPIHALAKTGYLGNTPTTPSLAISFRTLEFFRRTRLRKPSFSVEAFTKVICDLYAVRPCPFSRLLESANMFVSRCRIVGTTVLRSLTHLRSTS